MELVSLAGFMASVWMVVGVWWVARRYPGYNHREQFLSELGAVGSPTKKLSPRVNNFPLFLLFIIFGIQIIVAHSLVVVGYCVMIHGLGTLVAGVFPMDADPYAETPSAHCQIHSAAGGVMFISLLAASLFSIFSSGLGVVFQLASAVATVFTVFFSYRLFQAYAKKSHVGLYQRLSYGCQLIWLSFLSLHLLYAG